MCPRGQLIKNIAMGEWLCQRIRGKHPICLPELGNAKIPAKESATACAPNQALNPTVAPRRNVEPRALNLLHINGRSKLKARIPLKSLNPVKTSGPWGHTFRCRQAPAVGALSPDWWPSFLVFGIICPKAPFEFSKAPKSPIQVMDANLLLFKSLACIRTGCCRSEDSGLKVSEGTATGPGFLHTTHSRTFRYLSFWMALHAPPQARKALWNV